MQENYLVRDIRASGTARETAEGINKPCKKEKAIMEPFHSRLFQNNTVLKISPGVMK